MTFLNHARNHSLCAYEGGYQVDVHHAAEILHGHFFHRYALDNPGVIHQYVDSPDGFLDIGNHLPHSVFIGDIA